MSKFMIIPEPHISSTDMEGRSDYINEIKGYMQQVYDIFVSDDSILWAVFVGDIFNRGFTDIDEYFYWMDWFNNLDHILESRGGCIYSAVGNHELSFSKMNPFWRFTSSDDDGYSTQMKWTDKAANPKGLRSLIRVPDVVELSDKMTLFFCHYEGIELCKTLVEEHIEKYGDSKIRVCICHNSIISSGIANVLRQNHHRDPLTHYIKHEMIESLGLFHKFDYVFNGHMHRAYSRFTITDESNGHKTKLMYLGSLGRTNSEEVDDSDLERCLYFMDTDDLTLDAHEIKLLSRMDTLSDSYGVKKKEKIEMDTAYKEICKTVIDLGNPVKELSDSLQDRDMIVAFECAVNSTVPQEYIRLHNAVSEVI